MFPSTIVALLTAALTVSRPPFPDLSDPTSAAFSFAAALGKGDVAAARKAYVGDQKNLAEYLDALAITTGYANRLQKAITARFGETGARVFGDGFSAELMLPVRNGDDAKVSFSAAIALADVKTVGDKATLVVTKDIEVRLKKTAAGWKVTEWPGPSPLGFLNLEIANEFLKTLSAEVEANKFKKLYQVVAAAHHVQDRRGGAPPEHGK